MYNLVVEEGGKGGVYMTVGCGNTFRIAEVSQLDSPNPFVTVVANLGLSAVEQVCKLVRRHCEEQGWFIAE